MYKEIDRDLARKFLNRLQKALINVQFGEETKRDSELAKAIGIADLLYDILHLEEIEMIDISQNKKKEDKKYGIE